MRPSIYHSQHEAPAKGFTLLELSIVLVIIGLIVGGVMVGRDLMDAAAIRAQISQIEQYNTAVNAFKLKYGYMPGDIPDQEASKFGFAARGPYAGQGDGNGLLEGFTANAANKNNGSSQTGENLMFWVDLSKAGLIPNNLSTITPTSLLVYYSTPEQVGRFLPAAKIGNSNFMYVYSYNDTHYFGLTGVYYMINPSDMNTFGNLTVQQAYSIDSKIDDGLPMSGNVNVQTVGPVSGGPLYYAMWKKGKSGAQGCFTNNVLVPCTGATPPSNIACYDNNNVAGVTPTYSLSQNGGNDQNCSLSFRFQ
jgi:prepilin-type N-terminal cleavage/methylation domain-containing protein